MTINKTPSEERAIILSRLDKRRYGAKVVFEVMEKGFVGNLDGAVDDPDIDLDIETQKLASLLRKLYAKELNLQLSVEPAQ